MDSSRRLPKVGGGGGAGSERERAVEVGIVMI